MSCFDHFTSSLLAKKKLVAVSLVIFSRRSRKFPSSFVHFVRSLTMMMESTSSKSDCANLSCGFSTETFDYREKAIILNTATNKWYPKQWAALKNGPRFDLSCASVNWNDEKYIIIGI